jgi:hypothetical protein
MTRWDVERIMNEYIIVNKTAIQKRIEELESKIIPNPNFDTEIDSYNLLFITKQNELENVLSQSRQAERMYSEEDLEEAFKAGREGDMVFNNQSPKYWDFNQWFEQL